MNINEIKKYAQRPPTDIEIFVELCDKIQNEINFLNRQAEPDENFLIDTEGNFTDIVRRYNCKFEPAGADSNSRHKIIVSWNVFDTDDWGHGYRCEQSGKKVKKGESYYTTKDSYFNSVEIKQKVKKLTWRSKSNQREDRTYYQFGDYGDKVTLKDHEKIIAELVRRVNAKVKKHEAEFTRALLLRQDTARLDNLPFDVKKVNEWDKDNPRIVEHLKELVSAKVAYNRGASTFTNNGVRKERDTYSLNANFDNLNISQLEWIVKLLKQVDVKKKNLDHDTYEWVEKGEPYKIVEA